MYFCIKKCKLFVAEHLRNLNRQHQIDTKLELFGLQNLDDNLQSEMTSSAEISAKWQPRV